MTWCQMFCHGAATTLLYKQGVCFGLRVAEISIIKLINAITRAFDQASFWRLSLVTSWRRLQKLHIIDMLGFSHESFSARYQLTGGEAQICSITAREGLTNATRLKLGCNLKDIRKHTSVPPQRQGAILCTSATCSILNYPKALAQ